MIQTILKQHLCAVSAYLKMIKFDWETNFGFAPFIKQFDDGRVEVWNKEKP